MIKDADIPTTSTLLAFEATVRHGSMTSAARELDITQPLVSQRIRSLEETLGGVLIDRSKKPLKATQAGLKFYNDIHSSIHHLVRTFANTKQELSEEKKKVSICAYFGFSFLWIMPKLQRLQEAFPDYLFEIRPTNNLSDMMHSHADILFPFSGYIGKHRFEKVLIKEEVFPVCSPEFAEEHNLKAGSKLYDLRTFPLLHKDKDDARWFNWQNWADFMSIASPKASITFCYNNYPLVVEAAVEGKGICLGWRGIIDPLLEEGKLIELGPILRSPNRGYLICSDYKDTKAIAEVIDWFINETKKRDKEK